jgi:predicted amidophosphoribosyltransferase
VAQLQAPKPRFQLRKPQVVCPECGKKAPKGATFCAYCGKSLTLAGDDGDSSPTAKEG